MNWSYRSVERERNKNFFQIQMYYLNLQFISNTIHCIIIGKSSRIIFDFYQDFSAANKARATPYNKKKKKRTTLRRNIFSLLLLTREIVLAPLERRRRRNAD